MYDPTGAGRSMSFNQGRGGYPDVEMGEVANEAVLDRHRLALYILTQKDRAIPSLQEMEQDLEKPSDLSNFKERITDLQSQHLSDLQRLYAAHAREYLDEALDRYLSKDDLQFLVQGENNQTALASYAKLDTLYTETRKVAAHAPAWDDDISRCRHDHLRILHPLQKQARDIELQEEEARKRREAQFPMSADEFRIKPKDVQLRAARFLTCDKIKQEKMLTKFRWAWRQVQPLTDEFARHAEFKAEVQAILIESKVTDLRKQ